MFQINYRLHGFFKQSNSNSNGSIFICMLPWCVQPFFFILRGLVPRISIPHCLIKNIANLYKKQLRQWLMWASSWYWLDSVIWRVGLLATFWIILLWTLNCFVTLWSWSCLEDWIIMYWIMTIDCGILLKYFTSCILNYFSILWTWSCLENCFYFCCVDVKDWAGHSYHSGWWWF